MVRIRRRPRAPAALAQNKLAWTAKREKVVASGTADDWATQKAKKALKKPLLAMTWGKCAFCEGRLGAQAYAQIEHYVSRKVDPGRAFEWENLLPACEVCNRSKGDADHQGRLLKPDVEDPEPFFWITTEGKFTPDPRLNEADTIRALETIRLCGLNREELIANRQMVGDVVRRWVERAAGLVDGLDQYLQAEWSALSDPCFNYKLVVRFVLTQKGLHDLAETDRRLFHQEKTIPSE